MESKTYAIVGGKLAKVPMEYADKINKKEMLVARAAALQTYMNSLSEVGTKVEYATASYELNQLMTKIIRLNRQIPPCVQFV